MTSKKQGTRASADSANDPVQVDETVRVPQNLINSKKVKGIVFGSISNLSLGWRRHLIKPSELAVGSYFCLMVVIYLLIYEYSEEVRKALLSEYQSYMRIVLLLLS